MKILRSDLKSAVEKKIINSKQEGELWNYFESLRSNQAKFHSLHVLYYFGGLLVLSSMSWFLTKAWSNGIAIMVLSFCFALFYLVVGNALWRKKDLKIPAGLLITAAVGLTPLFIYGLQKFLGVWSRDLSIHYTDYHVFVREQWVYLEVGTIFTSILALRFYKFPFLVFILGLSFWYLSMDITPLIFGKAKYGFEEKKIASCIFGMLVMAFSYYSDKKYREIDFAFWGYLFGLLTFWGSLSLLASGSEINKLFYCAISIALMICSVYLRRRVFAIFGAIGVFGYLSHLSYSFFKDSHIFPISLALVGLGIIFLGVKYQRNKDKIESAVESLFPNFLLKWRPGERV